MEPQLQHKHFFKSMLFFKKQLDDNQERNKLALQLEKEVDTIISKKDSKAFHIVLEQGYKPHKKQLMKAFFAKIQSPLIQPHVIALFNKSLKLDILKDFQYINKQLDTFLPDFLINRFPLRAIKAYRIDLKLNHIFFLMNSVPEYTSKK